LDGKNGAHRKAKRKKEKITSGEKFFNFFCFGEMIPPTFRNPYIEYPEQGKLLDKESAELYGTYFVVLPAFPGRREKT